jgi:hypothetical protein
MHFLNLNLNLNWGLSILLTLFAFSAQAKDLNQAEYAAMFNLSNNHNAGDDQAINRCLTHWNNHPFKTEAQKRYRIMNTSVKVMGIGGDTVDQTTTSYPQLVLVEPSVNVMSKAVFELMNPNGWYCFKSNVNVMSKTIINTHCHAQLADSRSGATVLGSGDDSGKGGVTVLGKTKINRICN